MRPGLVEAISSTPGVAAYFDLSFQHAAPQVLRADAALRRRRAVPRRCSTRCGPPRRTPACAATSSSGSPARPSRRSTSLCGFLEAARLDAVGIFGYSDEDGTEAAGLPGQLSDDEILARVDRVSRFAEELTAQRAEDRVGELVEVLVESRRGTLGTGRTHAQGPEVDGTHDAARTDPGGARRRPGGGACRRVGGCRPRRRARGSVGCRLCQSRGPRHPASPTRHRASGTCPTRLTVLRILLVPGARLAAALRRRATTTGCGSGRSWCSSWRS